MWKMLLAVAALAFPVSGFAQEVKSVIVGADPGADYFNGQLGVDPTGRGDTLEAWSSRDRVNFTRADVLLALRDMAWVEDDKQSLHHLWAPAMVAANGRYYLYYSVGPQNPTPSRLGVAVCAAPQGPCSEIDQEVAIAQPPLFTEGVFMHERNGFYYLSYRDGAEPARAVGISRRAAAERQALSRPGPSQLRARPQG